MDMAIPVGAHVDADVHANNRNCNFSVNERYSKFIEATMGTACLAGAAYVNLTPPVSWVLTACGGLGLTNVMLTEMHERNFDFPIPKVEAGRWLLATACTVAHIAGAPFGTLASLFWGVMSGIHEKLKLPEGVRLPSFYDEVSYLQASRASTLAAVGFYFFSATPHTPQIDVSLAAAYFGLAAHSLYVGYHRHMEGNFSPSVYFAHRTAAE